jgi:hypothetical protein
MSDPTQRVEPDARTLITYAACTDACLAVLDADLPPHEGERLQRILDRLTDMGVVTLATVDAQPRRLHGIDGVIGHLRSMFGVRVVDAAVGAAEYAASPIEPPHAIIPLTRFEPDRPGDTLLTAYGQLFGCDIEFKAFTTHEDGHSFGSMCKPPFDRWFAIWSRRQFEPTHLPGMVGQYVLLAASRASDR